MVAGQTALVLVSDHGMNTDASAYSQGFNLVDYFNSEDGGSHHVVTTRHPESEYKLRGLNPFVSWVVTGSDSSPIGKDYPTVMIDLDGNERASIQFRNADLHAIHLLRTLAGRARRKP